MTFQQKVLLTMKDACEFLQIKTSRLRTAIFKKEIPYIKLGRLIRFDINDLKDWIDTLKRNKGN